jgi:hypothetical protein
VSLDSSLLTDFLRATDQPHIHIALVAKGLSPLDSAQVLEFEKTKVAALPKLREPPIATHTVLVTQKVLISRYWSNLFYATDGNFAVVSMHGVYDPTVPGDQTLALKYLASMIPLAVLHMDSLAKKSPFLPDRAMDTEHGCLHDFSADRRMLIAKLRKGPDLCAAEREGIARIFGSSIANEYSAILAQAKARRP